MFKLMIIFCCVFIIYIYAYGHIVTVFSAFVFTLIITQILLSLIVLTLMITL